MKEFIDSLAKLQPAVDTLRTTVLDLQTELSELNTIELCEYAGEILDVLNDELDLVDKHINLLENSLNWHIESYDINNPTQEEFDIGGEG